MSVIIPYTQMIAFINIKLKDVGWFLLSSNLLSQMMFCIFIYQYIALNRHLSVMLNKILSTYVSQ